MKNELKKSVLWKLTAPISELEEYYCMRRIHRYEIGKKLKFIKLRSLLHPFFVFVIFLDRIVKRQSILIISDKRKKSNKPVIYACTHIGYDDIAIVSESIKKPIYIFLGNPKSLYKDFAGLLLYLNGVIFLELESKIDRKVATETAKELLQNGGNLLIFPEGAWNITENIPVLKLFSGAVLMARETQAEIIPVAVEQYGRRFLVNIGENIAYPDKNTEIKQAVIDLRDVMCTLKWEIFEHCGITSRKELSRNYWTEHIKNVWGVRKIKMLQLKILIEIDFMIEMCANRRKHLTFGKS